MQPDQLFNHMLYTELIGFFLALLACALFSFLETSITALRLFKLKELANTTSRYQALLNILEQNPHQVLITILIANNVANVTAAALITHIMDQIFAHFQLSGSLGFSVGIGLATTLILIFGEIIPKNLAKIHGEKWFKSTLGITNIIFYALYPLVNLLIKISTTLIALMGGSVEPGESVTSEHEIRFLIDYINEKGLMEKEKTEMLQSIFKMGSKQVKEIMIPAIDIVMIDAQTPLKDSLDVFSKYQFSRLPVYENSTDNIIGMVHQKDVFLLISKGKEKPLKELVRPISFVPESLKINQLLREFRNQHRHIAIVLNEYGIIIGLVTLEDVLEEIVGEIHDEYEATLEKIVVIGPNSWVVEGSANLEALAKVLNITFDEDDVFTIGGFLTKQLQHVPREGEKVSFKGYEFTVQKANTKRVSEVFIVQEKKETE